MTAAQASVSREKGAEVAKAGLPITGMKGCTMHTRSQDNPQSSASSRTGRAVGDLLHVAIAGSRYGAELHGPGAAYLETSLRTATPQRLAMLLYDGAIQLCRRALASLEADQADVAADALKRAGRIVRQMQASLSGDIESRLCGELWDLCERLHERLIEADFYRRREAIGESLFLLSRQRAAWASYAGSLPAGPDAGEARRTDRCWVG